MSDLLQQITHATTKQQLRLLHAKAKGYMPREAIELNVAMRKRWKELASPARGSEGGE